ncbi:MAG: heme exporter protein CcmB, partial [Anaerolineaceae bacterium]|nr:heme exporter protein CcmB [Anaerolineaceae bacterium]
MVRDFLRAALIIAGKDLRAELRSRELLGLMALFALLAILVFSVALELDRPGRQDAVSGVLWVTLLFASILGHNRSVALEREHGGFDALLLAPVARGAIFLGKLLANALFTLMIALLLLPLLTILYNLPDFPPALLLIVPPGCLGLAAIGTLLAAMTMQTRARDSLLPVLLLPVALPPLFAVLPADNAALG